MKKSLTAVIICITLLLGVVNVSEATESRRRKPSNAKTGLKIGLGAGAGAGLGALIGGKKGAAAGALIGGGAMAGHSVARRDSGYGRKGRMIGTIATGTAVGAGVGTAVGGGKGAAVGALVGGGASTVYALTRKDLKKPSNSYEGQQLSQQGRAGYSSRPVLNTSGQISNDDPYNRLSGPQGAGVGSLLSNGSSTIY